MLHIKMPYGYNSFCFDYSLTIFTGKIRIKADYLLIADSLKHCTQLQFKMSGNNNQYTTVSFATTCSQTNDDLIKEINSLLCSIMHKRIDAKYSPKNWEPEMIVESFDWNSYTSE